MSEYSVFRHYDRSTTKTFLADSKEEAVRLYTGRTLLLPGEAMKVWVWNTQLPERSTAYPTYFMKARRTWQFKLVITELGPEDM